MAQPIEIRVERRDEGQPGENGEPSAVKRTWRVAFSLNAGAMGLVHVGIGLCAGAVSVRLAGEQDRTAGALGAWLPELKAALEGSAFVVDELSVRK
jgi:hypothetical protein